MPCGVPNGRRLGQLAGPTFSRFTFIALVLPSVLLLVACGDSGSDEAERPSSTTTTAPTARPEFLAADVQVRAADIKFPQQTFTAQAGKVTIGYVNQGRILHSLVLQTADGQAVEGWRRLELASEGDFDVATVTLGPGDYILFCDVPGHRAAGMEATLSVRE